MANEYLGMIMYQRDERKAGSSVVFYKEEEKSSYETVLKAAADGLVACNIWTDRKMSMSKLLEMIDE